ncbi:MAG: M16 family metallopeptidase [Planctomycetota bacterium]|jgi:predicted Zn-dependent peptidase
MPYEFRQAALPNGLEVVAEIDPDAHTAAVGFFVRTGARDEESRLMGVSHFLEHMMFKGTETRSAADVDRDFDDLGADHNAFTTSELTAFWAHCLPEHVGTAEGILSDILRPALRDRDFDDEKQVILEEIAMYQDHPFWVLYEHAMEKFYGIHPLGHRVLGTAQTIREMAAPDLRRYFQERYSSDNTIVALAGCIDFDRMVERLHETCGHWAATHPVRHVNVPVHGEGPLTIRRDTVNRHYVLMLAPAPAIGDDRRYAAAMLAHILGDVEGSRLYWSLVETGLADEAQAQFEGRDGTGEFLVYASCPPERAEEVERVLHEQISGLVDSLTDDDLERARSKLATAATLHGELPAGRMRRIGRHWTYTGEYRSLENELARINAVRLGELRHVHGAFALEPLVTARLMPA